MSPARCLVVAWCFVSLASSAAGPASSDVEELRRDALKAEAEGSQNRALATWERIVALAPHDWRALYAAGHHFLRVGNVSGAAERLESALAEPRPEGTADFTQRIVVELACAKSRQEKFSEALQLRARGVALGATDAQFDECRYKRDPEEGKPRIIATLERTECFGTCPVYRVTVRADGSVEWLGQGHVAKPGVATAKLSNATLAALRKLFTDAKYFDLKGDADCHEMTDQPSVITSYDDGTNKRTIRHYLGCSRAPSGLSALEERFDALVTTEWVGKRE